MPTASQTSAPSNDPMVALKTPYLGTFHAMAYFTHLELNSLLSQIKELFHLLSLANSSVIGISEMNFDSSFFNNEIAIEGYDLVRLFKKGVVSLISSSTLSLTVIKLTCVLIVLCCIVHD